MAVAAKGERDRGLRMSTAGGTAGWLAVTLLVCLVWSGVVCGEEPGRLRVLCYNIHHGEGTDGKVDLPRIAEVIRGAEPDVVALQEVDHKTARTGGVDQTAVLAELTGLEGRFAKQLDYDGGEYGQAILSRHPTSEVTVDWLPGSPDRERRIAGSVTVRTPDLEFTFVTTHLHHQDAMIRESQAGKLNELFAGAAGPVILAGDLNATPDSRPIALLLEHWTSATQGETVLTFPATGAERQLDYVLLRPTGRFKVISARALDEPLASDHLPLLVEVEIAGE